MTTTEIIPFQKQTQLDPNSPSGTTKIVNDGINGTQTKTYKITKSNGVETKRELIKAETTIAPIDEMTTIGTDVDVAPAPQISSNCDPNYTPCVPNVSYDLDCPDIGFSVTVIGTDVHRFDRDQDGYGCESY